MGRFRVVFVFGSFQVFNFSLSNNFSNYKIKSHPTFQKLYLNSEGSQIMSTLTSTRMHQKADVHLLYAGAPTVAFNPIPRSLALPTETCSREEAASKQWQLDKRAPLSSPVQWSHARGEDNEKRGMASGSERPSLPPQTALCSHTAGERSSMASAPLDSPHITSNLDKMEATLSVPRRGLQRLQMKKHARKTAWGWNRGRMGNDRIEGVIDRAQLSTNLDTRKGCFFSYRHFWTLWT